MQDINNGISDATTLFILPFNDLQRLQLSWRGLPVMQETNNSGTGTERFQLPPRGLQVIGTERMQLSWRGLPVMQDTNNNERMQLSWRGFPVMQDTNNNEQLENIDGILQDCIPPGL
ncbi:uncharacterized protein LOC116290279 [Actinia tenebrosa]|uniref:Uncharacterized protein LOC116290279 n=1 Tax=Actinia tenebrosa TaxID=6105 RepID=A0A6P8H9K4_ACTTE|nr:uncharacterized protein LOC116290279 [Actinia tenebrosa]